MHDDNGFGVPAGWYPDPLGLPQMRWWDNHGWTEHTTEARAPIVLQEAKLAWADDEDLPTRRERRERERETDGEVDSDGELGGPETTPALAPAQLEIESPLGDATAAEFTSFAADATFDGPPLGAARLGALSGTQHWIDAAAHDNASPSIAPLADPGTVWTRTAARAQQAPSPHTTGAWIIALIPLLQLLATLLYVSASGPSGSSVVVLASIWFGPYLVTIPLAISDRIALRKAGYEKPASWLWALLTGPVYLIARAISIVMQAGNGFGPILVWGAVALLQIGSVVAVPGLIISALPQAFAMEAQQSILHDASKSPTGLTVSCPAPPATIIGQRFYCTLASPATHQSFNITASLQRQNGWIAWQVDDWGLFK